MREHGTICMKDCSVEPEPQGNRALPCYALHQAKGAHMPYLTVADGASPPAHGVPLQLHVGVRQRGPASGALQDPARLDQAADGDYWHCGIGERCPVRTTASVPVVEAVVTAAVVAVTGSTGRHASQEREPRDRETPRGSVCERTETAEGRCLRRLGGLIFVCLRGTATGSQWRRRARGGVSVSRQ